MLCYVITARGLGSALAPPAGPGWSPAAGHQTVFVEFQAKNLASSINDLHEMKHQTGGNGCSVISINGN